MGSTYLNLTNRVLRRINEVEIPEGQFPAVRGIQSLAKDVVLDAVREITQQKWQWPFLAVQHSQELQIGENEYSWPEGFQSVDWESFQIIKDTVNPSNQHLIVINKEDWYKHLKDTDEDTDPNGSELPKYVFKAHGHGFGVTPVPDKNYTIEFRYFREVLDLKNANDECDIPSQYDHVITWGALYHLNLFRENPDGAQIAEGKFKDGLKNMYLALVGSTHEDLRDTRVNFGGTDFIKDNYR